MGAVIGLAVALSRTAPPAFAVAAEPINFGVLALLALALPLALVHFYPALARVAQKGLLAKYPEAAAVFMVVLIFVVAELMQSGALANVIGIQVTAFIVFVVLIGAGLLFVADQYRKPSLPALLVFLLGWCAVIYWQLIQRELPLDMGTLFVTFGVIGLLVFLWIRPRSIKCDNAPVDREQMEVRQ
jgi:hypothetical protein